MIAATGALACVLVVVPTDADARLARRLHAWLGATLALLTLASVGILLSRTLEMNGGAWSTLWTDLRPALSVTHFGHVWIWRVPALALAWLAWAWGRRRPTHAWTAWLIVVAVAAIALTRSDTGHMADHGDFAIGVWLDWLHLLAAGAWVGTLFGMSLVVFPHLLRSDARSPHTAARTFQRLSTLSGVALALLLACGIYSALGLLGSIQALWTSRFGIVLDIKLAIVLVMIGIGAHNRYFKLPRLLARAELPRKRSLVVRWLPPSRDQHPGDALRASARAVLLESVLGLAVIGATGVLIHQMPPADMPAHAMPMAGMTGS